MVLGDLATIVQSDLAESLGGRSQIADTSWIAPGRVAWSWWSDSLSPHSPDRQRAFVISRRTGGTHFVVNAAVNGRGPARYRPLDGFFWIGNPGRSSGDLGKGDPPTGQFFLSYALMLIRNADYRIR